MGTQGIRGSARLAGVAAAAAGLAVFTLPGAHADTSPTRCDWPMYQHDDQHTGAAPAACPGNLVSNTTAPTLVPHWFVSTSQNSVTASPIVANNTVFVGDSAGFFYALAQSSGAKQWTLDTTTVKDGNTGATDQHATSYGQITSTAAYDGGNVYLGAGGSVMSVNATTGAVNWATNMDPTDPTSPVEVESSPFIYHRSNGDDLVIVGDDVNEARGSDLTGLNALDAKTGQLVWQFQPQTQATVAQFDTSKTGTGCGDVWGSPAFYDAGSAASNLFVFGSGNCDVSGSSHQYVWAVRAESGTLAWRYEPSVGIYGGDDDIGSSVIIPPTKIKGHAAAIALSKSGYVDAIALDSGVPTAPLWHSQVAQPGQTGPTLAGAIGGFIGSAAVSGTTLFAAAAIPTPFSGNGPCDIQNNPSCLASPATAGVIDTTLANNPMRLASLHAVDLQTGADKWDSPVELPSYAAVTYSNGVVFAPSTTSFSSQAFDAATGAPVWLMPLAAAASSGTAIVGNSIFFGAGTAENSSIPGAPANPPLPPQIDGIWSFNVPSLP